MEYFFENIGILVWAFASWYFSGLGFALILFPRNHGREIFLLAPLVGLCLLSIIGLMQITVLLVPLYPRTNTIVLVLISILLCLWRHIDFLSAWRKFRVTMLWLWFIPIVLLLAFSWLFHKSGFELLVGGSDQLQYSQNARQINEEMHTGSMKDMPVPRQQYYVYEKITRTLPYIKSYRRGAEVMLATTASVANLPYEEAFPVMILNALLTLGLTVGFLGCAFFSFSLFTCFVLQVTFLSSFYLLLTHIEGSLALMLSIAPLLVGLALLERVIHFSSLRWWLLAVIVVAGYLSIYSEPAVINIILPTLLLVLWEIWRFRWHATSAVLRIALLYLFVFLCIPFGVYSVVSNAVSNLLAVYQSLAISAESSNAAAIHLFSDIMMQQWNFVGVVFGGYSYYDMSYFNAITSQFFSQHLWLVMCLFYFICGCSLIGYLKIRSRLAYLFSFVLLFWILSSTILVYQQDTLRFARSIQYEMPFIILGLVILACETSRRNSWDFFWKVITQGGRAVLLFFVCMNVYTNIRTANYLISHDISNDSTVLRFSERKESWYLLKKELSISAIHNAPVLISGFKETVRPFAIAIDIRSQPHMLGQSISGFWPIYDVFDVGRNIKDMLMDDQKVLNTFNTRFSEQEYEAARAKESKSWLQLEPKLLERTEQAVVSVGNGYPVEWESTKDIYPSFIKRFPTICDVVYRRKYTVNLMDNMTSPLKKDSHGPFRILLGSGSVIIHDKVVSSQMFAIDYEGKDNDISLKMGNKLYKGHALGKSNKVRIEVNINPEDVTKLSLQVAHPVKLRSLTLMTPTASV